MNEESVIRKELEPLGLVVSIDEKRNAHDEDEDGVYPYEYTVPISVRTSEGTLVVDICECENEKNMRMIQSARSSTETPVFLFLKNGEQWQGCFLYRNYSHEDSFTRVNNYGIKKMSFNIDKDQIASIDKSMWKTTFSEIIQEIKHYFIPGIETQLKEALRKETEAWFAKKDLNELASRVQNFICNLQDKSAFWVGESTFSLKPEVENQLFQSILGNVPQKSCLIRFSSLGSLCRILQTQTHTMLSVVCMNDKTECTYASQYLDKGQDNLLPSVANVGFNNYITSLSVCDENDLTMWRLYGDGSKGVALVYSLEGTLPSNFYLAPVSYAEKDDSTIHHALEFVSFLMCGQIVGFHRKFVLRQWNIWQHFFKSADYYIEREVRLLYCPENIPVYNDWILTQGNVFTPIIKLPLDDKNGLCYPLKINKIILGPNCPEKEVNKAMLESLLDDMDKNIKVEVFEQSLYRP